MARPSGRNHADSLADTSADAVGSLWALQCSQTKADSEMQHGRHRELAMEDVISPLSVRLIWTL